MCGICERTVSCTCDATGLLAATYQGAVAHELAEVLILALVDLLLQDTQSHRLLDDIIIIGNIALIDTALEESRGIMATARATVVS